MQTRHDQRYKKVFSNPIFIEKLLTSFVHEDFIKELDFSDMKRVDKSFIDKKMAQRESDIIYKINFKDKPVFIYLLLEFQSTVDNKMPLRFLRYILELTESYGIPKGSRLYPAVFPLLLYNGERNWTAKYSTLDLFEASIPSKFIPSFCYYPIIIKDIPKKVLLKIRNAVSAIFLLENSNVNQIHRAFEELVELLKESSPAEVEGFKIWLNSLLYDRNIDIEYDIIDSITEQNEEKTMLSTTLDKLEEMYKTEGLQEGKLQKSYDIAKNLLKEGSEPEFVSKVTGLTLDEVKKL